MSPDPPDASKEAHCLITKAKYGGAAIELPRAKIKKGSGAHVNVAMSVGAARFLSALNAALQHSRGDRANNQNNVRMVAWEGSGKAVAIGAFSVA